MITIYRVGTKSPRDPAVCTNWFATLEAAKEWAIEAQIEGAVVLSTDPVEIKPTAAGIVDFLSSASLTAVEPATVVDGANLFERMAERMREKLAAAEGIKVPPFKE